MKAVAIVSVVSVRTDKSDKAEIVAQLLFGESMDIIKEVGNWTKIKMHYDGYEGWVDTKQISCILDEDFTQRNTEMITERVLYYNRGTEKFLLSAGAEVERENEELPQTEDVRDCIVADALGFLNVPYLWGGRSFFGIDCSGFTQIIYKINGVKLPRDAYQQAECGEVLDFIEESKRGDLAFFENENGDIIHVGIMLDNQKIIHAHGKVRIDELDSVGIFNKEQNKHTHKLRIIKRIIEN